MVVKGKISHLFCFEFNSDWKMDMHGLKVLAFVLSDFLSCPTAHVLALGPRVNIVSAVS